MTQQINHFPVSEQLERGQEIIDSMFKISPIVMFVSPVRTSRLPLLEPFEHNDEQYSHVSVFTEIDARRRDKVIPIAQLALWPGIHNEDKGLGVSIGYEALSDTAGITPLKARSFSICVCFNTDTALRRGNSVTGVRSRHAKLGTSSERNEWGRLASNILESGMDSIEDLGETGVHAALLD